MKSKNIGSVLALMALAFAVTSCATGPQAFHNTDNRALVIDSLDSLTCQRLQPTTSARETNDQLLAEAAALPQHQTAVVILENYTEEKLGDEFRDRGTALVIGLRNLGYEHIVFLQGLGVTSPEGLTVLVQYD